MISPTRVRRLIIVVLLAGVVAFVLRGADGPADPSVGGSGRRPLTGFGEVAFTVTSSTGRVAEWCALLADTEKQREQGLMDQTGLRGYDGMVFRWTSPVTDRFYMFHTRLPLSIAWFDDQGAYVSAAAMPPCAADDPAGCPTYGATGPYLHAIEVGQGGLRRLGVGVGATLAFAGRGCA